MCALSRRPEQGKIIWAGQQNSNCNATRATSKAYVTRVALKSDPGRFMASQVAFAQHEISKYHRSLFDSSPGSCGQFLSLSQVFSITHHCSSLYLLVMEVQMVDTVWQILLSSFYWCSLCEMTQTATHEHTRRKKKEEDIEMSSDCLSQD